MIIPAFLLPAELPLVASNMLLMGETLLIQASSSQSGSICPICACASKRRHSNYLRKLVDLPTSGYHVKVIILSGKYFCDNIACPRKIFTERYTHQINPYHRRFDRCRQLLANFALELGRNKGSAISRLVKLPVSASSILRIIKRQCLQIPAVTSGIIGIDDWAFKKGRTYGTNIVDLQFRKVIDLLPDRESETVSQWLKSHPEVKIIARDRGGPYSKGAHDGAPQAVQIADRFHLLMNLGDATQRMFQGMGKDLKTLFALFNKPDDLSGITPAIETTPVDGDESYTIDTEVLSPNIAHQIRFAKVKELFAEGFAIKAIARSLHIQRTTIRKYIGMDFLPQKKNSRSTNFDAFQCFLLQESKTKKLYTALFDEIVIMGFNGRYTQFCHNMNELLNHHKIIPASQKIDPASIKTWSPRSLAIMLQKETEVLSTDESKLLKLLYDKHPAMMETILFINRFKNLFRVKAAGTLLTWLEDVAKSTSALKSFAKGIRSDFQAVNNAVITSYSSGQVEGQVNRLKNIKRRMYGKAGFELLRRMVVFKSG